MCDTNKQQPILPVSFTYCGLTVEIAPPTPEETAMLLAGLGLLGFTRNAFLS